MRRRSPRLEAIGETFLIVGFLLALPLILPIAAVAHWRTRRLLRRAAQRFHCQTCGTLLGLASIELADATQKADEKAFRKAHPGVKPRRKTLHYHAICTSCGTRYRFDGRNSFIMDTVEPEQHRNFSVS